MSDFPTTSVHVITNVQRLHLELSRMADQKANMLLAATFVVFTVAVGQARNLSDPLPLVLLAGFALAAAICAMLVVLPSTRTDDRGTQNLFFFGSFTGLTEDAFVDQVIATLKDDEQAYRLVARDIYQNGQVLRRKKYRLLGLAYRIFLAGLVVSMAAFVVEVLR